jgi:hypothetical protein
MHVHFHIKIVQPSARKYRNVWFKLLLCMAYFHSYNNPKSCMCFQVQIVCYIAINKTWRWKHSKYIAQIEQIKSLDCIIYACSDAHQIIQKHSGARKQ